MGVFRGGEPIGRAAARRRRSAATRRGGTAVHRSHARLLRASPPDTAHPGDRMTPRIPRVCVKLYADSAAVPDETFIPIFHRWIRDRALDLVFIDVADYAHVPDGPGVMLVTDAIAFALDRSDGRFGLLAQQRRPGHGSTADAIALALRQTLEG